MNIFILFEMRAGDDDQQIYYRWPNVYVMLNVYVIFTSIKKTYYLANLTLTQSWAVFQQHYAWI